MIFKKIFLLAALLLFFGNLVSAQNNGYYDEEDVTPLEECDPGFYKEAGVCFPNGTGLPNPEGGLKVIIVAGMQWLLGIFGFIAIIAFVISGIQYLISAGNENQIDTAKRNMKWSLVGVVVGLAGYIIIKAIDSLLTGLDTHF